MPLIQPASWAVWSGGSQQTGGDKDEDQAGNAEEAAEVDPHSAPVEAESDRKCGEEAENGAGTCRRRVGRILKRSEEKDGGLESSRSVARKAIAIRARVEPVQSARHISLQGRLDGSRVPSHPDDHVGDGADGNQPDDGLHALLLLLRELFSDHPQNHGDRDAEAHGDSDPDPHLPQSVTPALLDQEGGDNADDQRCLDSLRARR